MNKLKDYLYKFFFLPPLRFRGGLLLNLLGLQILRYIFYSVTSALAPRLKVRDDLDLKFCEELKNKGHTIIDNFLNHDDFLKIQNIFKDTCKASSPISTHAPFLIGKTLIKTDEYHNQNFTLLSNLFAQSQRINSIISRAITKNIFVSPSVKIQSMSADAPYKHEWNYDYSHTFHFDVCYPTIKCFFYINDINHDNGALEYCIGSHQFSLYRLWLEYKLSINYFFKRCFKSKYWFAEINEKDIGKKWNIKSLSSKKNSLVIVNTCGIHRRGVFKNGQSRDMFIIDYRMLKSFKNLKRSMGAHLTKPKHSSAPFARDTN